MSQSNRPGGVLAAVLFIAAFLGVAFVVATPTSASVQAILAVLAVAGALLLSKLVHRSLPRLLFLILCALVMLRYLAWRYMSTMPSLDDPVSFAAAALLLGAETWMIAIFLLGAFMMADPQRRSSQPASPQFDDDLPTVDVLVPSLNEPEDLLAVTLAAAKRLDYPADKLTVVLCDDGGTDARCADPDPLKAVTAQQRRARLSELCEALGVIYRTRPANVGAKAGNLNEAMLSLSGDLVAIFDADHAPTPDFLRRTVGSFANDERLFLVQTPHMFLNGDPIARNLGIDGSAPPENEMFYGQLHDGLDRWEGAFFCGSAALLRRAALDEVGGISGETITEDAETALDLHARGWRSLYLNRAMIAGLQPETFASLIGQRGRWATGMIQILLLKNPLLRRGLRMSQRLCYLNSMAFWFFPLTRMIMLAAPLAYLLFDIELFVTTKEEALAYMLGYIGVSLIAQHALFAKSRWPFQSEIYEIAQTPYLLRAVLGTLLSPRGARFKVTAKDELVGQDRISEIARPLIALFLVMAGGAGLAVWRYLNEPAASDALVLVGAWAFVNMILTGAALGAVVDKMQRRAAPRVSALRAVGLQLEGVGTPVEGRLVNASAGGAAVDVLPGAGWAAPSKDTLVRLSVADYAADGSIEARVAGYSVIGGVLRLRLAFTGADGPASAAIRAALVHADSRLWEARREGQMRPVSLLGAATWALRLFFAGVPSAILATLRGARTPDAGLPQQAAIFPALPEHAAWSAHAIPSVVNGVNAQDLSRTLAGSERAARPAPARSGAVAMVLAVGFLVLPSPVASQSVALPEAPQGAAATVPAAAPRGAGQVRIPSPIGSSPDAPVSGAIQLPEAVAVARPDEAGILSGLNDEPVGPEPLNGMALLPLRALSAAGFGITADSGPNRFAGGHAGADFLLIVPEGARPDALELTFQNSAFVLPAASRMRVLLNGVALGQTPLDHIAIKDMARFAIPAGLPLQTRNRVTVEVAQTHRLYCGAAASYDLWTDIDLASSGVRVALSALMTGGVSAALARMAAAPEGRVAVTSGAGHNGVDAGALPGARASAAALRGLIGAPLSFVPATGEAGLVTFAQGTRPLVTAAPGGLRIVLDDTGAAPIAALQALGGAWPELGTAPSDGAAAAPELTPGTATALRALGLDTGVVVRDRWSRDLSFSLPAGYLPSGALRAELSLTFAHIAGLPEGSMLRVLVNGTSVRMIPADAPVMVTQRAVPVRFDARLLGAGRNVLTLQFERSAGADATLCGLAGQTLAEIDPASTLTVPETPSFRVASLDGVLTELTPGAVESGLAPDPFGPSIDVEEGLRALTVASALAPAQGVAAPSTRTLRLVPQDQVAGIPLGRYAVLGGRLAAMLEPDPPVTPQATPVAERPAPDSGADAVQAPSVPLEPADVPRSRGAPGLEDPFAPAGSRLLSDAATVSTPPGGASGALFRAEVLPLDASGPRAVLHDLRNRALPDTVQQLDLWLRDAAQTEAAGRIALISLDPARPDETFLVASASLPASTVSDALATAQANGGRLVGHLALWSAEAGWAAWHDPQRLPVLAEDVRLDTAHAVIGAYAEQRPLVFAAVILAAALFVAAIASAALIAGRRAA